MKGLFAFELFGFFDFFLKFGIQYGLIGLLIFDNEIGVRMGILVSSEIVLMELF